MISNDELRISLGPQNLNDAILKESYGIPTIENHLY